MTFAPGDRVIVRDRLWRIRLARPVADGVTLLELEALDGGSPATLPVVAPPEVVVPVPPQELAFDLGGLLPWHAWAQAHQVIEATLVRANGNLVQHPGSSLPNVILCWHGKRTPCATGGCEPRGPMRA